MTEVPDSTHLYFHKMQFYQTQRQIILKPPSLLVVYTLFLTTHEIYICKHVDADHPTSLYVEHLLSLEK